MSQYSFNRNDIITLNVQTKEDQQFSKIDLSENIWVAKYSGVKTIIDWRKIENNKSYLGLYKEFIAYRFETVACSTVNRDFATICLFDKFNCIDNKTLFVKKFTDYLISKNKQYYYSAQAFFKRALLITSDKKFKELSNSLLQSKPTFKNPYNKIGLVQLEISTEVINKSLQYATETILNNDTSNSLIKCLVFLISFELGLRPIQLHFLNKSDFKVISSNDSVKYYSIRVQTAKKKSDNSFGKRFLSISKTLGEKIEKYIQNTNSESKELFGLNGERISKSFIQSSIKEILKQSGYDWGQESKNTPLRHHLAQSLANQGSSAEIISEVLGHNSTVAAQAYIKATPDIAEIKTRALGKSERFNEIINMLRTGKVKKKEEIPEERWVSGIVGQGYIGGIGGCGLESKTPCPKNPIYSCYTCQKFHPFKDGNHEEVLKSLRIEVQRFIDHSEEFGGVQFNRSIDQLEFTIESVLKTLKRLNE